jgi:hypothetical protein
VNAPPATHPMLPREAIYAGEIEVIPANPATLALVEHVARAIQRAFGAVPMREVRPRLSNNEFFRLFSVVRQGVPRDPVAMRLARAALASLGVDLSVSKLDRPRVRAVPTDGHLVPEARAAYGLHRDIWYANPRAQINHWIPLHDVTEHDAIGIFPDWFARPIANGSAGFDYAAWASEGGFQAYDRVRPTAQHHPVPETPPDLASAVRFPVRRGDVVRFSAAHLHGPMPHSAGLTRYSVELRTVNLQEQAAGLGAPAVDNASRGDASVDYLSGAGP